MRTRAQALLGQIPLGKNQELDGLALELANRAHGARASSTVAQYKEPWREFQVWAARMGTPADNTLDVQPELVAMYLMYVYQSAEADEVGHGRVSIASAAIACNFFLAGQPSPTDLPACALVRELSKRTLHTRKLNRGSMQPEHIRAIALRFAGPDALLPDLMMVVSIAIMFAGFLRFSDLAQISVQHDKLVIGDTHMAFEIPRSKTDQVGKGHTLRIARVGGPACPVGLTERLLTLGAYTRVPGPSAEEVGPLLRRVKISAHGHALQQITGAAGSRIPGLSYTSFREKFRAMCDAVGIDRGIMPHSLRIGGNSTAAAHGVPEEARKAHGRWKSDEMVRLYTRKNEDAALEVTRNLGLA